MRLKIQTVWTRTAASADNLSEVFQTSYTSLSCSLGENPNFFNSENTNYFAPLDKKLLLSISYTATHKPISKGGNLCTVYVDSEPDDHRGCLPTTQLCHEVGDTRVTNHGYFTSLLSAKLSMAEWQQKATVGIKHYISRQKKQPEVERQISRAAEFGSEPIGRWPTLHSSWSCTPPWELLVLYKIKRYLLQYAGSGLKHIHLQYMHTN